MSAGILRNWYLAKVARSSTPVEYFFAMQEFMLYEMNTYTFNLKEYFQRTL